MKTTLEILDFEDKSTQAGKPYVRFKTNDGWMSCFDSLSNTALKKLKGQSASVEVIEQGDFKNIKKCYGASDEVVVEKIGMGDPNKANENLKVRGGTNHTTMYVSYAKDIFLELDGDWTGNFQKMEAAIAIVKQAKEAFE